MFLKRKRQIVELGILLVLSTLSWTFALIGLVIVFAKMIVGGNPFADFLATLPAVATVVLSTGLYWLMQRLWRGEA